MSESWERIKHEQSKAFYYFTLYRDMGPFRSLDKVYKNLDENKAISLRQLEKYSSKYNWLERAQAYDDYLNKKKRESNETAILKMDKRQAEDYKNLQTAILQTINKMQEQPEDPEVKPLTPNKTAYFLDTCCRAYDRAAKGERLVRGETTERIDNTNQQINIQNNNTLNTTPIDPPEEYLDALEEYNELFGIPDEEEIYEETPPLQNTEKTDINMGEKT